MIPLNSYPEVMAEVRVIASKDQLESTVKTLQKAGTLHTNIRAELQTVGRNSLKAELYITDNLPTRVHSKFAHIQATVQAHHKNTVKLIYTRPFWESECRMDLSLVKAVKNN